jgi:anti-repressor protein
MMKDDKVKPLSLLSETAVAEEHTALAIVTTMARAQRGRSLVLSVPGQGKTPKDAELRLNVGRRLHAARVAYDENQTNVAIAMGVTSKVLSAAENGRNYPDELMLIRFCRLTGCSLDWLYLGQLGGTDPDLAERIRSLSPSLAASPQTAKLPLPPALPVPAASQPTVVPFTFEGAPVRAVMIGGEPHFVGKDVAERLEYADTVNALKQHCRGVVKHHPIVDALGRSQKVRVLAEPDVLRLIIGSKLPAAERFERWVFEEVLPTIRKTGSYGVAAPEMSEPELMARAVLAAQRMLIEKDARIAELEPKAEAMERLEASEGSMCLTDAAKALGVRPHYLLGYLSASEWIYRRRGNPNWLGYSARISAGCLEQREVPVPTSDGATRMSQQVRITAKGLARLAETLPRPKSTRVVRAGA